ncbi:3-hydroxybenzoate synthase [subsurface metagenome]
MKKQTLVTIDNIMDLISDSNLVKAGISNSNRKLDYSFVRIYIKDFSHLAIVKEICDNHFKDIPVSYLIADICRDDLLVEIEGVVELV